MNLDESIKNYTSKKIKVSMEYLRKTNNYDFEPYRTIDYLIEKAKKLFFIVKEEVKIIHNNKDLTPFKEISISEYFKNKNKIHLKMIQISNNKKENVDKNLIKSNASNLDLINPENINSINNDISNEINLNTINNTNSEIKNIDISINNSKIENLTRKDYLNKVEDRNTERRLKSMKKKENEFIEKSKFLCECKSNLVKTYFDREENTLICKNCRTDV